MKLQGVIVSIEDWDKINEILKKEESVEKFKLEIDSILFHNVKLMFEKMQEAHINLNIDFSSFNQKKIENMFVMFDNISNTLIIQTKK